MASKKGNMKRKLRECKIEWPSGAGSYFIPVDSLNDIMQLPDIIEELEKEFPGDTEDIRRSVAPTTYSSAKRLLAVLVCCNQQSIFLDLLRENVTDQDLPFTRIESLRITGGYAQRFKLARKSHSECQLMDHDNCGIRALEKLEDMDDTVTLFRNQWLVLAPVFRRMEDPRKIQHLELNVACILPFTEERKSELRQGGYSDVWPVRIHPAHQEFSGREQSKDSWFVVKRLHSADSGMFNHERRVTTVLTSIKHPHLVNLLATWRQNGQYHFLFPYASRNLQTHWDRNSSPPRTATTWLWAISQMRGLAWALNAIHILVVERPLLEETINPQIAILRHPTTGPLQVEQSEEMYGRHGDIKPENILFFRDPGSTDELGTLQIADFGLTCFDRVETRSLVSPMNLGFSPTYSPPELYLDRMVSRAYDIWSMGCVYLQFITWLLEGSAGLQEFADTRTELAPDGIFDDLFYSQLLLPGGTKDAKLRDGVDIWIHRLRQNPACSEMLADLLDLVKYKMLRIEAAKRIKALDLNIRLKEIEKRARSITTYLMGREAPRASLVKVDPANENMPTARAAPDLEKDGNEREDEVGIAALKEPMQAEAGKENPARELVALSLREETQRGRSIAEENKRGGGLQEAAKLLTDSAYASVTYAGSTNIDNLSKARLEATKESREFLHTDSAFSKSKPPTEKQDIENYELHRAETNYSPSETPTLPRPRDEGFVINMAAELFSTIEPYKLDKDALGHISEMLPDLLRTFALKMGYKPQNQMQLDISYFIRKRRRIIQASFEDMFQDVDADAEASNANTIESNEFAMDRFLNDHEIPYEPETQEPLGDDFPPKSPEVEESDHIPEDTNTSIYRDFTVRSPAYNWLVATLQREAILTRATPDLAEKIRKEILDCLQFYPNASRKAPSQEYRAIFELDWDPLSFVKEQQYAETPQEALERAITITGTVNDAQAVTTGEYLSQAWPATGKYVMQLVADAIRNTVDHNAVCRLPDGTELEARIRGGKFIVTTIGTEGSIAETGQQFGWLGAALRSSLFEDGVAICSPFAKSTRLDRIASLAPASAQMPSAGILCVIKFDMQQSSANEHSLPGQCWHKMFRNPVMVSGYPILAKKECGLGLEMPLNIIAALAGSERANEFDGKVFIKGFSIMLIATKVARDLLIWHYFYNYDGEKISYLDHTLQGVDDICLHHLDTARHVVGWCSDSMYYAGAADAEYDIDKTCLPQPHAGCLLEKVTISAGKVITGGVNFALAVKDIAPHFTHNNYVKKLQSIAKKYVVFWDEADKRGWLVNGTSALLHLVRSSLHHYGNDEFSSAFLFDPSKMRNAADHRPQSAPKVLINNENKEMAIYPGKTERFDEDETKEMGARTEDSKTLKKKRGYYLFEDLVEQHYNYLDQIMDYHRKVAGRDGVKIKARVRNHLEGWDFWELATDRDPRPRVATLNALGYGWVDFIRTIDAVTLFGRGFGEIIRPIAFDGMCPKWRSLPAHKYYLAASVFDINNIMGDFGGGPADPMRIVRGLLWHCPGQVVAPCRCQIHETRASRMIRNALFDQHHDPVQSLYPERSRLVMHINGPGSLEKGGAVIFGHSVQWGYRWRENGHEDLEEDVPPPVPSTPEHQNMNISSLGSLNRESRLLTTSGSSQSRGSIPLGYSTPLTLDESIVDVDSVQDLQSTKPNPGNNAPGPSQRSVGHGGRRLRHERRRL